ncbi:DUF5134 domain-containing protein [Pseudonocardia sichuanensis]
MFASTALSLAFTVVFVLTAGYLLVRMALLTAGTAPGGDRLAELSHLLMSLAMVGMATGWTGGPASAGGVLQLALFGLLTVWFLGRLAAPAPGHARTGDAYHLVMVAAMVWMVAAMPQLMGMTGAPAAGGGAHAHHHGGGTAEALAPHAVAVATPPWVLAVNGVFVALLAAAAVLWGRRAVRPGTAIGIAAGGSGAVVATRADPGLARLTGPRADACCHLLMSIGMGAMLLAM